MEVYNVPGATIQMWSFEANKATLADAASATDMALRPTRSMILYNRLQLIETTAQACTWLPFDDKESRNVIPVATPLIVKPHTLDNISHSLTYGGTPVYTLDVERLGIPDTKTPWSRWVNPPLRKKHKGAIKTNLYPNPTQDPLQGFMLGVKSGIRSARTHELRHVHTVVAGRVFVSTAELEKGETQVKQGSIIEKWGRRMRVLVRNDNVTLVYLNAAPVEFDAHFLQSLDTRAPPHHSPI